MAYPKMYFHLKEVNGDLVINNLVYKPKGPCLFRAVVQFSFSTFSLAYTYESGHRMLVAKFAIWQQSEHIYREYHFFNIVTAMRLEALLKGDTQRYQELMEAPVIINFMAYTL